MNSLLNIEAQEQLHHKQKLEAVGRLAGGIAHDFTNFLTIIQGNAEILLQKTDHPPDLVTHMQRILGACSRARDLTRKRLSFSRHEPARLQRTSLEAIIRELLDMLKGSLSPQQIHLNLSSAPRTILVDETQIAQALLNLCLNARDAMGPEGTLEIETEYRASEQAPAELQSTQASGYGVIRLRDSGPGIPEEIRPHIFEPFFATKGAEEGTGLGLAVTLGIIENHGGLIRLLPADGPGCCFEIWLPLPAQVIDPDRTAEFRNEVCPDSPLILIIDDDAVLRETMADMLEHLGYQVKSAGSGPERLARLADDPTEVHLVLLDMLMPGMDGSEVFHHIRRQQAKLPILICSGFSQPGQLKAFLAEENTRFPAKPFPRELLARRISEMLAAPPPLQD